MKELDIYKLLPGKNCRECPSGTCISFAVGLKKDLSLIDKCPHLEEDRKRYLLKNLSVSDWRDELIESLKKEVSKINFKDVSGGIGALLTDEGLVIRCIGIDYLINKDGSILPDTKNKWIKILLLHYIRTGGKGSFTGRWISFSDFKGGLVKATTFQRDCESALKGLFDNAFEATLKVLERLGGKRVAGYTSDLAIGIDLLPKVRILVLYSRADEEFPSSLKILFDAITPEFLDVESIIFLLEGLLHTIKHIISK